MALLHQVFRRTSAEPLSSLPQETIPNGLGHSQQQPYTPYYTFNIYLSSHSSPHYFFAFFMMSGMSLSNCCCFFTSRIESRNQYWFGISKLAFAFASARCLGIDNDIFNTQFHSMVLLRSWSLLCTPKSHNSHKSYATELDLGFYSSTVNMLKTVCVLSWMLMVLAGE